MLIVTEKHVRVRLFEYLFVLKHLKPFRVLDVGCCESPLSLLLAHCDLEVFGCDVQRCYPQFERKPYRYNEGTFQFICSDIRRLDIPDGFFDTVINVSTVEHIGLVAYDQKLLDKNGDSQAMQQIRQLLKPSGVLIFTFDTQRGNSLPSREYDDERLAKLLEGFTVQVKEYRLSPSWTLSSEEDAKKSHEPFSLCIKAIRNG